MDMQVRDEVAKAVSGYTVSVQQKAVLGRFRDIYFMRSGERRITLPVEGTDPEVLQSIWQRFRADALANHEMSEKAG
jgi:hypothetical protein